MEVTGVLKVKGEAQTFGTFQKREFVVVTADQYPQTLALELHQDKCDLLDSYNVGDNIKVSINLRGREWINPEGVAKYFNSIQGWRIEKVESEPINNANEPITKISSAEPQDLPF